MKVIDGIKFGLGFSISIILMSGLLFLTKVLIIEQLIHNIK